MAYNEFKLTRTTPSQLKGVQESYYYEADLETIDQVLAAGYFTGFPCSDDCETIVTVNSSDGWVMIHPNGDGGESEIVDFLSSSYSTKNGFIDYNDTGTSTTPITLVADTWTDITNNGLGLFTNKSFKPQGVSELMDNTTGDLDVADLPLGTTILVRNDFSVTPNTNNALLEFRYTLGVGGSAYTLEKLVGRLDSGSGKPYRQSLTPDLIYMGDTNTRDNPIGLEVRLSTAGTLVNAGSVIQVVRQ